MTTDSPALYDGRKQDLHRSPRCGPQCGLRTVLCILHHERAVYYFLDGPFQYMPITLVLSMDVRCMSNWASLSILVSGTVPTKLRRQIAHALHQRTVRGVQLRVLALLLLYLLQYERARRRSLRLLPPRGDARASIGFVAFRKRAVCWIWVAGSPKCCAPRILNQYSARFKGNACCKRTHFN